MLRHIQNKPVCRQSFRNRQIPMDHADAESTLDSGTSWRNIFENSDSIDLDRMDGISQDFPLRGGGGGESPRYDSPQSPVWMPNGWPAAEGDIHQWEQELAGGNFNGFAPSPSYTTPILATPPRASQHGAEELDHSYAAWPVDDPDPAVAFNTSSMNVDVGEIFIDMAGQESASQASSSDSNHALSIGSEASNFQQDGGSDWGSTAGAASVTSEYQHARLSPEPFVPMVDWLREDDRREARREARERERSRREAIGRASREIEMPSPWIRHMSLRTLSTFRAAAAEDLPPTLPPRPSTPPSRPVRVFNAPPMRLIHASPATTVEAVPSSGRPVPSSSAAASRFSYLSSLRGTSHAPANSAERSSLTRALAFMPFFEGTSGSVTLSAFGAPHQPPLQPKVEELTQMTKNKISPQVRKVMGKLGVEFGDARSSRAMTPDPCSICFELPTIANASLAYPCLHAFCDACISEWVKTKNSCPNCQAACTKILYNLRAELDYDSKEVQNRNTLVHPAAYDGDLLQFFIHMNHRRATTTAAAAGRSSLITAPTHRGNPYLNQTPLRESYQVAALYSRTFPDIPSTADQDRLLPNHLQVSRVSFRRRVYAEQLNGALDARTAPTLCAVATEIGPPITGEQGFQSRLMPWLRREVMSVLGPEATNTGKEMLYQIVLGMFRSSRTATRADFVAQVTGYIAADRVDKFWEQMVLFLQQRFAIGIWDEQMAYFNAQGVRVPEASSLRRLSDRIANMQDHLRSRVQLVDMQFSEDDDDDATVDTAASSTHSFPPNQEPDDSDSSVQFVSHHAPPPVRRGRLPRRPSPPVIVLSSDEEETATPRTVSAQTSPLNSQSSPGATTRRQSSPMFFSYPPAALLRPLPGLTAQAASPGYSDSPVYSPTSPSYELRRDDDEASLEFRSTSSTNAARHERSWSDDDDAMETESSPPSPTDSPVRHRVSDRLDALVRQCSTLQDQLRQSLGGIGSRQEARDRTTTRRGSRERSSLSLATASRLEHRSAVRLRRDSESADRARFMRERERRHASRTRRLRGIAAPAAVERRRRRSASVRRHHHHHHHRRQRSGSRSRREDTTEERTRSSHSSRASGGGEHRRHHHRASQRYRDAAETSKRSRDSRRH
ncbi:hypothetical protein BV898_16310 [Hypsibius exemplaris]|uniref:RING-type E3 ubiquitin transferase n=1 Tax=Hypsibius exemplaris TaxID=2072580 RepID=A0A9X6NFM0_HYPEX|nr:hypothetical protein BV898_16310 [Hypsibius exemplaris]